MKYVSCYTAKTFIYFICKNRIDLGKQILVNIWLSYWACWRTVLASTVRQIPYHPAWCLVSRPSQFFLSLFRQRHVITHLLPFTGQGRQLRALWLKHAQRRKQYKLRNTTNSNMSETDQYWSAIPHSQMFPLPTASHCRDGFWLRPA